MSFRIEKKIYIKKEHLIEFKNFLFQKNIREIYKPREVESIYFDNCFNQIYFDSIEGLCPRKKIRIRNYPEKKNKEYFLEYKISSVEGRYKKKNEISLDVFNHHLKFGIFDTKYGVCKPNLIVKYNREYLKKEDVRITIDTDINYKLYNNNIQKKDSDSIIELKTTINKNLDDLLKDYPFQEIRFSKYCNGMELFKS